jgi:hypothetical protein
MRNINCPQDCQFNKLVFSHTIIFMRAVILTVGLGANLPVRADCGPIEVCPEKSCKPLRDCSALGNSGIGTDAALARARCETQQEAELSACRAQQNETEAACSVRQRQQLSQCVAAAPAFRIPDLCETIKLLLLSSKKGFDDVRGSEVKGSENTKW